MKDRVDDKQITDAAVRFHFAKHDGSVGHLTVEPDVQARLTEGGAAVVAFMGYNGLEHAVIPTDVAHDVRAVRPDWLRHLAGVTDVVTEPPADAAAVDAAAADAAAADAAAANGATALDAADHDGAVGRDDAPANDDDAPARDAGVATDEDAPHAPADDN